MSLIKRGGATKGLGDANAEEEKADQKKTPGGTTRGIGSAQPGQQPAPRDDAGTKTVGAQPGQQPAPRDDAGTKTVGAQPGQQPAPRDDAGTKTVGAQSGRLNQTSGDSTRNVGKAAQQDADSDDGRTKNRLSTSMARTGMGTKHQIGVGEEHMLQPDTVLQNRYAIEDVMGIGGMSVVYKGRDLRFRDVVRPCAIKEMYQRSPDSQTRMLSLQFFEREAGMLATLNHVAIPKVYDFFEENARMYLVMELIDGKDLETVLEQKGQPIDEARVANWAYQVCDVLEYLHSHEPEPIVFRDMKPSNVMVTAQDRVVLVDFGIARLLDMNNRKGTMIGTEGYASPEQFRGVAEPASDIYSLGATLHQLLSCNDPRGETPFTFNERPLRMLNPAVSPEMEAIVARALEYDMEARWPSATELKQALLSVPSLAGSAAPGGIKIQAPASIKNRTATTELVWSFKCEDEIRSSPCVAGGMVFVGCYDTNLYALDVGRGEFRWKYATEGGISSSPDNWEDMVIVGSEDGNVYGLDMRKGQARWKFRTEKAVRSSPRVEDRVIFVGSDDQHIYAIDGMRGTMLWKFRTWMPIRSSAAITPEMIYIGGSDNNVYCLDIRNGGMRWKQRTRGPISSTPFYSDGLVFVGSSDNHLYALDSEGGWPTWKLRTGNSIISSPFVVGTRVFVGSADGTMYAVDTKNGRPAWKYETDSPIVSSPRIDSGRLYFGSTEGMIYCLDVATGDLIWKYQVDGPVVSSAAIADGIVYIGSLDYTVYALKA